MAFQRNIAVPRTRTIAENDAVRIVTVEPPCWWTGMEDRHITVMIHGDNVASARPRVGGLKGVRVAGARTTDSVNYLFVDLEIDANAQPALGEISLTKDGRTVGTRAWELKERTGRKPDGISAADAVYLLMPDRFAASGRRHPGEENMREKPDRKAPYGRHGGDITGIRLHIDHMANLGMTALWTTPVMTNDMEENSYHGYAATDFYAVDPRLGTIEDYVMLASTLHRRGMKLVMDMVVNHCGTMHPWIDDAPSSDWLNTWGGDPHITNYRPSVTRDAHASRYDREHAIRGWFDTTMADINMANPMVADYMATCAIWWVETVGLDAIRMDTFPYSDPEGMRRWLTRVRREYPTLTVLAETWVHKEAMRSPWQQMEPAITPMDFPLQEAVSRAFTEDFVWGCGANRLYDTIACDTSADDNLLIFGDNHDTGRLLTSLGNDADALKMALVFLATTRGIPQLYYGTEMLMTGNGMAGHANIRQDVPGGWAGDSEDWFAAMPTKRKEVYDFAAKIFTFRRDHADIFTSALTHFIPLNNVYVYFRGEADRHVMVVLNISAKRQTLYAEKYAEFVGEGISGTDIISGRRFRGQKRVYVPARSAMVISKENDSPSKD